MLLSDLIVAPRLRQHWSSLDLGVVVAKKFWLRYFLAWLLMASPLYIILVLICNEDYFWLPLLIIWWLKPLFERPILFMLSQDLFNQPSSLTSTFRQIKQWLAPGWFYALTIRRLSPARSFFMPVILLERLKGKAYSQRTNVLGSKAGSHAFWLTITLVHIEIFLPLALYALLGFLFPFIGLDFDSLLEPSTSDTFITNTITFLSMAIIAPFYVSCGFILYICRRIELEAWDIEICFRDMVEKRNPKAADSL